MNEINEQLNELFEDWRDNDDYGFVYDGMMNDDNFDSDDYWNESLRIAFVTKEPYFDNGEDADGEDYREYDLLEMSDYNRFWKNILTWAYGIYNTDENGYPSYEDARSWESREYTCNNIPFSLVNIKKTVGGSTTNKGQLKRYARDWDDNLTEELQNILCPNIIVCCGTQDVISNITYGDHDTEQIDEDGWIHYDEENDILFIWGYHPSARMSDKDIYENMMEAYSDFLEDYDFPNEEDEEY